MEKTTHDAASIEILYEAVAGMSHALARLGGSGEFRVSVDHDAMDAIRYLSRDFIYQNPADREIVTVRGIPFSVIDRKPPPTRAQEAWNDLTNAERGSMRYRMAKGDTYYVIPRIPVPVGFNPNPPSTEKAPTRAQFRSSGPMIFGKMEDEDRWELIV